MGNEEYFELACLIRDHLLDLGLNDIADFSNYTEDGGEERSPPDGKTLIKLMLASFDRYLAANAAETVEESLRIIAGNIDEGEPPMRAFVHLSDDRLAVMEDREEPAEVVGLGNMAEMREALRRLERRLLDDPEPAGPDGGMA